MVVEIVGPEGVVERALGPALRFDPRRSAASYLRVRARDASGRRAFSQPLWKAPPPK
jgi:hypothetical protein